MERDKSLRSLRPVRVVITVILCVASAWGQSQFKTLHKFTHGKDGGGPVAPLTFDQAGNLYGTTVRGGTFGQGAVFRLTPNANGGWTEKVLHHFTGDGKDGRVPVAPLTFDQAGNLYGTTIEGGATGGGTVFKLTPNQDGSWTESVLYGFCSLSNCGDGDKPNAGLTLDQTGNLYGTTFGGGNLNGVVFKLTPNQDGSWSESVLHSFCTFFNCRDGASPDASLIFDDAGNLYGTTRGGPGVVFKLTPRQNGSWSERVLYSFCSLSNCRDGASPYASLIFDDAGNLYGTTQGGGIGYGVVFKLAPNRIGEWNETVLHKFLDHPGASPYAGLIFDAAGNLYGTTMGDGNATFGSVFEVTP
jgi:uncharacterized repeat protein (TIGR03803 family)